MDRPQGNTTQLQVLLDRAADGSEKAYDELIALASQRLLKLTRKMLRNYPQLRRWEQTDDVFQNAVLRLHRSLADVQPGSVRDFFGLAATQIRRTLIDLARHHFGPQGEAARYQSDGPQSDSQNDQPLHQQPGQDESPQTLEAWAEFHEAVERLPAEDREVFELSWYGSLSQAEVAEVLGISIPTVKRRFRSARLHLYRALQGESPLAEES